MGSASTGDGGRAGNEIQSLFENEAAARHVEMVARQEHDEKGRVQLFSGDFA
jgi:hypothetical protein